MNSSYGSDGMNTEKYSKTKLMSHDKAEMAANSNTYRGMTKLSNDLYAV
jgi:hypothetical protein